MAKKPLTIAQAAAAATYINEKKDALPEGLSANDLMKQAMEKPRSNILSTQPGELGKDWTSTISKVFKDQFSQLEDMKKPKLASPVKVKRG